MASSINASTTAGVVTTADTSGVLNIQTAGTTAISIDASQAVSFTNAPTVTGGTANGVAYLNGSKVLTTGSALQFDVNNTFSISQANNASCAVFTNSNASLSGFGNSGLLIQFAQNTTNNSYSPLSVYNSGAAAYKFRMADSGAIATAGSISLGTVTPATSGIGVQFPATQSASTNANTLDDYEEGTFTPSLSFGDGVVGLTYNYRAGIYVKVGNVVSVFIRIALNSQGSSTGHAGVSGLPFTANGTTDAYQVAYVGLIAGMSGLTSNPFGQISPNASAFYFYQITSSNYATLTQSNFPSSCTLNIQFTYLV